ncbi:MAG TPA: NADP-dependent malic enzyme [Patescibacteria group bacterium]|nr:NADP-dependent malic enzyme [Patescibacteria group bacterium]
MDLRFVFFATFMDYAEASLRMHREHRGKLQMVSVVPIENRDDLSTVYTPGVAAPCQAIARDPSQVYDLTIKGRTIAVITDGSAVLGLGNIGPEAALPVMEGKAILFKRFAGLDAFPICLATQDPDEIVETVQRIAPVFGGINLEDIAAPLCFEVEERIVNALDIPVMHDDQHGTAVVILAGLLNALKVVGKRLEDISIVLSGAGAAGLASARLLLDAGVQRMTIIDSRGMIAPGRNGMNAYKEAVAEQINPTGRTGTLAEALQGADLFLGVSKPGLVTAEMVRSMASDPILFAMANPVSEIMPEEAKEAGAAIVATGRSDFPNQANNVLAFPGIFLGALESGTKRFTKETWFAAARAIAGLVPHPQPDRILPSVFETGVARTVADAVKKVAETASAGKM